MKNLLIAALLVAGCGSGADDRSRLNLHERQAFDGLVAPQSEESFDKKLGDVMSSGSVSSVMVLSRAMIELPWEPELAPKDRDDVRMRKCRAAFALDKLVASTEFDLLCKNYMSAVAEGRPERRESAERVVDWVRANRERLVWSASDRSFSIPPPK